MNRKIALIVTISLVSIMFLTLIVYLHSGIEEGGKPFWLRRGTYMIYQQFFVWDDHSLTEYMSWNITELRDDSVRIHLTSHGANVTDENVEVTIGDVNFTMNLYTREIINCSEFNYIGQKWPFWIETNVTMGSPIDIWYGANVIIDSESIYVLGQKRDCWIVEYNWTTASMKRWYDRSSGLCLKIHVILYYENVVIQITETAVLSSIEF